MNPEDLVGKTLGQYQLRSLLGYGGMGCVYRADQIALARIVAIKVISPRLVSDARAVERFRREAQTAARLGHAHIIPVHDYGVQDDISYLVMRYLEGGSLWDRLQQRGATQQPLPTVQEIADLLRQLASALDYAHGENVIHRDIKPNNVMFDNQGSAYLVDFGIAKLLGSGADSTTTGILLGTPSFMAPELWRDDPITPAVDQYALAAMIYVLLTGEVPFHASTPYALMHKHLNETPTPPQVYRAEVPEAVTPVLERAMAKDPSRRFPTVTAFAQSFSGAISSGVPKIRVIRRGRSRGAAARAGAVASTAQGSLASVGTNVSAASGRSSAIPISGSSVMVCLLVIRCYAAISSSLSSTVFEPSGSDGVVPGD